MTEWLPRIVEGPAPLYERLIDALELAVRAGDLVSGDRLPPHRELAHRLSISVGTVSRAYAEAERRGLVSGHVGRGSFIAGASLTEAGAGELQGPIDMARNLPPLEPAERWMGEALNRVRRRGDLVDLVDYGAPEGLEAIRRAGADWLRRRHHVERVSAERLIQCNGGQQGLALAFAAVARAGDAILCEAATYPGIRTIADHAGYRLTGVAMDDGGIDPEALDRAVHETGARVLVLIPTLHNPTTVTLNATRRSDIAAVARARNLMIIEDDAYRVLAGENQLTSFADLLPEQSFLVAGLAKSLAPGLRLGFVLPPEGRAGRDRLILGARALGYCPPVVNGLIFSQWIDDGVADRIADDILAEARRRVDLARSLLGDAMAEPGARQSLHVWLPMSSLDAERVAGRALRAGVELTPPSAPVLLPQSVSGLRLCLGAVRDIGRLRDALMTIRAALEDSGSGEARGIV